MIDRLNCTELTDPLARIACQVQNLSDGLLNYAILIAAIGTVAMALVDVFTGACRLRGIFNKCFIECDQ